MKQRKGIKRLAYPNVLTADVKQLLVQDEYRKLARQGMFDMDDPEIGQETKDNAEFILNLNNPDFHTLEIDLKPNETLARERKLLREEIIEKERREGTYDSRIDKNILFLYIDNISRAHFLRKMPETSKWLEHFVDNDESEFSTYQFFKYHSCYFATTVTNAAMFYGENRQINNGNRALFGKFKENGYVTGISRDLCNLEEAGLISPIQNIEYDIKYDHLGITPACDLNMDVREDGRINWFKGPQSSIKHCFYGWEYHMLQFEYLTQFWEAYPDNRKYFRANFMEAHEGTGELIGHLDVDFRNFLEDFRQKGYLDDTMIVLIADHGAHGMVFRLPFIPDNSRHLENYLPMLFIVAKDDIPYKTQQFMKENEQAFIGSFDIYKTFSQFATNCELDIIWVTKSFMHESIPNNHTCHTAAQSRD